MPKLMISAVEDEVEMRFKFNLTGEVKNRLDKYCSITKRDPNFICGQALTFFLTKGDKEFNKLFSGETKKTEKKEGPVIKESQRKE